MPKSGFIAVLGRTNAGKSSLINYLLNTKIAMVSHKQNATRRLLKAIVMDGDNQL
ncbi:MAG: GTPase, partial [Campylobacter sp.]|nr:GTPase [Campylobacter sp.]